MKRLRESARCAYLTISLVEKANSRSARIGCTTFIKGSHGSIRLCLETINTGFESRSGGMFVIKVVHIHCFKRFTLIISRAILIGLLIENKGPHFGRLKLVILYTPTNSSHIFLFSDCRSCGDGFETLLFTFTTHPQPVYPWRRVAWM